PRTEDRPLDEDLAAATRLLPDLLQLPAQGAPDARQGNASGGVAVRSIAGATVDHGSTLSS
ncbi:MAG: hypothetical protein L0Y54_17030, partial [Sporichthyaceae bacterium]|nr:hypothetical protein [Sporichthyaceae bacterium]